MELNKQEKAVLLCALRHLEGRLIQDAFPPNIHFFEEQGVDGSDLEHPTPEQIDELCDRIELANGN